MGEVSTIGLDIAKAVFQVHGVDGSGAAERGHIARVGIGRPGVDKCDHRQHRLLRAGGERPRNRRSAEPGVK
jgi:hypothetical protein